MKGNNIKMTNTASTDFVEFLTALRDLIDSRLDGNAPTTAKEDNPKADTKADKKGKGKKSKPAPEPEPEDVEDTADDADDDDPNAEYRAELEGKSLKALRQLAIKAGFDKDEVNDADEESIIESLIADRADADADEDAEDEDAEGGDEDEADEDEGDEGDEYTREDFEALSLKELRKVAKDEYELSAADIKGLDKDGLIAYLLGEDEEEEEPEDDEDEEAGYTEDDLKEMSLSELKELAKEWEVPVRAGSKSKTIIKDLMAAFAEADEEDEDEDDE